MTKKQHKEEILATIRWYCSKKQGGEQLLGIANAMHGSVGRIQFDLEEMVKEGVVSQHVLTSHDEYGDEYSYYVYTA